MRKIISALIFSGCILYLTNTHASDVLHVDGQITTENGSRGGFVASDALSAALIRAIPTKPLAAGKFQFNVAGGYFNHTRKSPTSGPDSYDQLDQDVSGANAAFSLTYAFTPHWGISAIGGYTDGSGDTKKKNTFYTDNAYSGNRQDSGGLVALNLVFDPFTEPEGFRLPLIAGIGFSSVSGDYKIPFTYEKNCTAGDCSSPANRIGHQGQEKWTYDSSGLNAFFAAAPQFNTGPVRWSPFVFDAEALYTPDLTYTEQDLTTGESVESKVKTDEAGFFGVGLGVMFRPWNLSFTYVPPLVDNGSSDEVKMAIYSLDWTKEF